MTTLGDVAGLSMGEGLVLELLDWAVEDRGAGSLDAGHLLDGNFESWDLLIGRDLLDFLLLDL